MADDLNDKSLEELEAMLTTTPPVEEAPADPEPAAEEPPAEAPAEEAPAEPEAPSEDPEDLSGIEAKIRAADEARRDAEFEKLKAHNSRLAGQIGDLMQKLRTRTEPYTPEPVDDERVASLQAKLQEIEQTQKAEAKERAIAQEVASLRERPDFVSLSPDLVKAAAEKYADAWTAALDEVDPDVARLNVRSVMLGVAAEAQRMKLEQLRGQAQEKKAEQTRRLSEAKRNAAVSASGSTPPARPKPTPLAEKSLEELEQMLRSSVR